MFLYLYHRLKGLCNCVYGMSGRRRGACGALTGQKSNPYTDKHEDFEIDGLLTHTDDAAHVGPMQMRAGGSAGSSSSREGAMGVVMDSEGEEEPKALSQDEILAYMSQRRQGGGKRGDSDSPTHSKSRHGRSSNRPPKPSQHKTELKPTTSAQQQSPQPAQTQPPHTDDDWKGVEEGTHTTHTHSHAHTRADALHVRIDTPPVPETAPAPQDHPASSSSGVLTYPPGNAVSASSSRSSSVHVTGGLGMGPDSRGARRGFLDEFDEELDDIGEGVIGAKAHEQPQPQQPPPPNPFYPHHDTHTYMYGGDPHSHNIEVVPMAAEANNLADFIDGTEEEIEPSARADLSPPIPLLHQPPPPPPPFYTSLNHQLANGTTTTASTNHTDTHTHTHTSSAVGAGGPQLFAIHDEDDHELENGIDDDFFSTSQLDGAAINGAAGDDFDPDRAMADLDAFMGEGKMGGAAVNGARPHKAVPASTSTISSGVPTRNGSVEGAVSLV
ncbi:unnamed protein product [Vitrella brassicaformis CCMP3155]|uniref:Uncharacterized protein n=2 Tax=Vitrella brassicaformis TaxID=1169539 RepID=A0A0G4EDE8_VITBC|nr:unnamed protein product [Vitrella brassicaformis CCMP3155]|eukprot:CEL94023.1 unnamed protein product [Vitrella brassicaformis CCMP3155]